MLRKSYMYVNENILAHSVEARFKLIHIYCSSMWNIGNRSSSFDELLEVLALVRLG